MVASLGTSDSWRRALELVRDTTFAYVVLTGTYQFGHAVYQRGLPATIRDAQQWLKLVMFHFHSYTYTHACGMSYLIWPFGRDSFN